MLIGRRDPRKEIYPDIDLSVLDVRVRVSRIHAEINRATGGFYIEDKGSMNGTFVNGQRLKANQRALLKPGSLCRIAEIEFRFTGSKLQQVV